MNNFFGWVNRNILNLFLVFFIVLNIMPVLAPILLHLGANSFAGAIYTVYSFFCHQQHWKSLHLFDYQVAWCARDMFIWASMLFTLVLVKSKKVQPLGLFWLLIYTIPIALDGGLQTVATIIGFDSSSPFYTSNNFFRMITGTLFGGALGLFMFPRIKQIIFEEMRNAGEKQK